MNRMLVVLAAALFAFVTASSAQAQYVNMSGGWYNHGITVKLPVRPVANCLNFPAANCPRFITPFGGADNANTKGLTGPAATIMGGLNPGDPFTLQPILFTTLQAPLRTIQVPANFAVQQLNSSIVWRFPGTQRAPLIANKPANPDTRMGAANHWSMLQGQTGRVAALTQPENIATNGIPVNMNYTPGANVFGSTMASLQTGNGNLYLNGAAVGSSMFPASLQPGIATQMLRSTLMSAIPNIEPGGAGWDATNSGGQPAGNVRGGGVVYAPACTSNIPPLPLGCELVVSTGSVTLAGIPSATSVRRGFAWTTGAITVTRTGTQGGAPATQTLQIAGSDTNSGGVRNVGLVAGRYATRVSVTGTGYNANLHGLSMSFVPEPASTVALFAGIGALGLAIRRRAA